MTAAQAIALNPTAVKQTLEKRVAELSDLLHTLATVLAILRSDFDSQRAWHKSSLEATTAPMTREMLV